VTAASVIAPRARPRLLAAGAFTRRTVAELAAVVQVGIGAGVVLVAAERGSWLTSVHSGTFSSWFAGPLHGLLPSLTTEQGVLQRGLGAAQLAMLVAWLLILLGGRSVRAGVVIAAVVALNLVFLFCPLLRGSDVFNYLGYARLDAVHHLNPYVDLPLRQHADSAYYAYSDWHRLRSPYGPLFTLLLLPVSTLPLPVAYWIWKVVATVASLGLLAAVWACARRLGRPPAQAVAFVGLNPLVLVWALGGKHNDLLLMACVMGGCLLVLSRRGALGGATLAAAVAIKASAGLLAPVILLGMPGRRRSLAGFAAGALALAGITFLTFGPHLPNLHDQGRLVSVFSIPNLLGYAAGRGGADSTVLRIARIAMVGGFVACAAYAWRTRRWATAGGWAALVAIVTTSWLVAWYILWALPFVAISSSRVLRAVTLVVTVWFVLVGSWVAGPWLVAHGFHPRQTPVGRANHQFELSVLTDGPATHMRVRRRTSGRPPMLPRLDGSHARPPSARRARPATPSVAGGRGVLRGAPGARPHARAKR
jgi:alpha-1,6-mannosyltransferase